MSIRWIGLVVLLGAVGLFCKDQLFSQDIAQTGAVDANAPQGVEVQARGPIHEAFATPTAEAKPTYGVPKKPPAPIEEMPPEEKPEGDVVWIGGYWAWDDDRADFLWVSGCWRTKPAGMEWVSGYWREVSGQHQWVPGFWAALQQQKAAEVTYYAEPPPPPQVAAPPPPAEPDMFYVPGHWFWVGDHYVWRPGYYQRVRTGYVYVPSHYRWTPFGFVFVAGYWDFTIGRRGVLYAPVVVNTVVVGPRFVYTPYYAVSDTIIVDAFFVRPGFCHYYFGDYYGPRYAAIGFECGFHYSRSHYDAVVVYSRWEYRNSPGWFDARISLTINRNAGRAPVPPRTLVQQNNITIINNNTTNVYKNTVIAPTKTVVASRGAKTVTIDNSTRMQVKETSIKHQNSTIAERSKTELAPRTGNNSNQPRTANLSLPHSTTTPIGNQDHKGLDHKGLDHKGVTDKQTFTGKSPVTDKTPATDKQPFINKQGGTDKGPMTTKTIGSDSGKKVNDPGTGKGPMGKDRGPTLDRPSGSDRPSGGSKKSSDDKKKGAR